MNERAKKVLALSGGVGGAKLALGLAHETDPDDLHVIVNTADDFSHLGLHISPDIDTLLYTLSGCADPVQGWGLADETFNMLDALAQLGGEDWFRLGDRDLATHLWRSAELAAGNSLSRATSELARRLGVDCHVHPMTDDAVHTRVATDQGQLAFQHYFVRERCEPRVSGFSFDGLDSARPNGEIMALLEANAFAAIVICPSNPFVSVDPILGLQGLWPALRDANAPVVLVSPIVAGIAIKGPAAKMMSELDMPVTALGVAEHYHVRYPGLVEHFVIDESDGKLGPDISALGLQVNIAATVMKTLEDKRRLARHILALAIA